ncbi:MAG: HTH-type transcriptional regulator, sugar sensing transcriptional regulator [Patescibacteria group bacterium]|jgi:sugar-specific transcriptional regulator TrmB|nr:HTH-type transcriptional regulator, sugar sensing transcriptional regulator [Patescibacteria group bacterium]
MLNNKNDIKKYLTAYGLSTDEAKVYLALLEKPLSHLELARKTGVNRTKIYRIADDLEKLSLVKTEQLDSGKLLSASEPKNLEVNLVSKEQELKNKRAVLNELLPSLDGIFNRTAEDLKFSVSTYEGVAGMKQMLWNELKTKGEILVFGSGTLEDLVGSKRWAEAHRQKTLDVDYKIREINNHGKKPIKFTSNPKFYENFNRRHISEDTINLEQQIAIYNDTVGVYHWRDDQKVGTEIHNKAYANMMRQVFENYWELAEIVR